MSREGDLFDRAIYLLVTRVPGRIVAAITLLLYPGLGLLVPVALTWSGSWLAIVNFAAVMLAAFISLGWLGVQLDASRRRQLVEWTTNLRLLNAEEFEWFVGELYRREGWTVREPGKQDRPDGNIDLVLTRGKERRLVQVKRWTAHQVGVSDIRAFAGTLLREHVDGQHGDFVTLSSFTEQALSEAKSTGITLIDGRDLYRKVDTARAGDPCPVCGQAMRLDRSPHGWWFRCTADGCSGKRDLGADPGRAVELLTQRPPATGADIGTP